MDETATRRSGDDWHAWLIGVVAFATIPRGCDLYVQAALQAPTARLSKTWLVYADWTIIVAVMAASGFAIDRFGVRRTISIGFLIWGLSIGAAGLVAPMASVVLGMVAKAAIALVALGTPVVLGRVFAPRQRARVISIIDVPARSWFALVPLLGHWAVWPPTSNTASNWPTGFLVAGLCGLVAGVAWWLSFRPGTTAGALVAGEIEAARRVPGTRDFAGLFRRPPILGYVAVFTSHAIVFNMLISILPVYLVYQARLGFTALAMTVAAPVVVVALAQLICSVWSDRRLVRLGRPGAARQPFVTVGALLASLIALVPFVGVGGVGIVFVVVAAGFAMTSMIGPLGLDLVPSSMYGRFSGITYAASMLGTMAAYVIGSIVASQLQGMASFFIVAGMAALLAAAIAWLTLRDATPIDEGPDHVAAIGRVFS